MDREIIDDLMKILKDIRKELRLANEISYAEYSDDYLAKKTIENEFRKRLLG